MTREEALRVFQQEHSQLLEQCQQRFIDDFPNKVQTLMERINHAFASIRKQVEEQEKEKVVFFHFSLLRCDLLVRKFTILLQVQDIRWFLDPMPLETLFSVDFLYENLVQTWDWLLDERKKYIGKVSTYDVEFMMSDLIFTCNRIVGNALRYFFRDIEDSTEFMAIPKEFTWDIYWGEYRNEAILTARVARIPKTQKEWQTALQLDTEGTKLSESYWYQASLETGNCSGKLLCFMTFEDCQLKNINFKTADLTGARFCNCLIENCDFESAILTTTLFENCRWLNTSLLNAELRQAVFTEDSIPEEGLDDRQLSELLLKGGIES